MNCKIRSLFLCLCAFCLSACALDSIEVHPDSVFFSELEQIIIKDYKLCTGDSIIPSQKELLQWKSEINFLTESMNYPEILKKYAKETSINPSDVRPCEIINWYNQQQHNKNEADMLLNNSRKKILARQADSIFIIEQLHENPLKPFHFNNIPFGITKRGFILLADRNGIIITDKGDHFTADSVIINLQVMKGAFHFNKNGLFTKYELESQTGSLDSLDLWIRPMADSLSTYMEQKLGAPDHSYRIGRFDITEGKLAVTKFWNLPDANVYIGLATFNYRYYAKLIVNSDMKLQKVEKNTVQDMKSNKK